MNTLQMTGRRQLLQSAACGFGSLALAGLFSQSRASESANPLTGQETHFPARAKRVIFIFMQGGPSQVDTFDYKPALEKYHGTKHDFRNARRMKVQSEEVMKSHWTFKKHGESGQPVSSLFPEMAKHVDDLCFIRSMHTEGVAHGPSTLFLHTGATNLIRPSMGAWISYGLGTENQSLPSFVTVCPTSAKGGPRLYSNAFLPPVHQGTALGRVGIPAATARFENVQNPRYDSVVQQRQFDLLREMSAVQLQRTAAESAYESVLDSYELAYRMQSAAPEVTDISGETRETLSMYGIDQPETEDFGYQCLRARRLSEAGVRFVQISYADNRSTPRWDQHGNMPEHEMHAKATDKPVAGLLQDLKQRGLLEDTLVWWGGEFGRTPFTQGNLGRDHNPDGFTVWLAGGGVKRGFAYGETDEFGQNAIVNKVHMHDLHATILHLLGLDHERLTFRHAGRDFRLTDVHGRVVKEIFA
ncbi:DUF1501 domain-containing protein [Rubinisphaera margarita]|uniref:DUF1501 domain-containing protein n=1 Tax=Rubinisphaera margarita TaxID=2909586 RepID=UPI001EE88A15|nr:DUF1501 domain-containing protein [Rubinisphaera margarita]MCG6156534.1 DUF1501 domain-containing protein [Rubinisphaera margarita]